MLIGLLLVAFVAAADVPAASVPADVAEMTRPLVSGTYPRIVWTYLGAAAPGEKLTRREQLVAQWKRLGLIAEPPSLDAKRKIDALTRPVPVRREVEIDVLQDRSLMLWDVRARISSMKQGLLGVLEAADSGRALTGGLRPPL